MTHEQAQEFARQWVAAWNRRDVETVLARFNDDISFTSPTALAVAGSRTVHGKTALREYWATALARISTLQFTLDYVLWDVKRSELAIVYSADIDGRTKRVSENLRFNKNDLVIAAEVFHGV